MSAESSSQGLSLESLQQQLQALEVRVAELEAEVQHELEDIEHLKEVTKEDHERLETLKSSASSNVPPPSVTPVGL